VQAIFDPTISLNHKGDILGCAKIAGVFAAKRTSELIPLCHQVPLSQVLVDVSKMDEESIRVTASAKTHNQTGVEIEALTAVSVASLTIYDMTKSALKGSVDKITITDIQLVSKTGGSSTV
jgi:cyclic pyranopterin phosphate synthase